MTGKNFWQDKNFKPEIKYLVFVYEIKLKNYFFLKFTN